MTARTEDRVLVLAPTSGDAALTRSILTEAGLACDVCTDFGCLCHNLEEGAGVLLLTEEALNDEAACSLAGVLQRQPSWSDVPLLLLCGSGADSPVAVRAMEQLGNVTILEQPVRVTTMISALRTALKARRRQYELRTRVESLRYQLDLTRSITDNATTAIFMMDEQSRCTFMNPAAEHMTGFSFEHAQGQTLHDLIHHQRPDGSPYPLAECPIDRALPEQYDIVGHEDVFIRSSGEFFPVLVNAKPIHKNGAAVGTVIEVRDITEQKKAEQAIVDHSQQLRRLAQIAMQINVAYDLPSILGIITEEARSLIGAHQCVASLTANQKTQAINSVSLSDKYSHWHGYDVATDESGIYARVCRLNEPMRLSQAELEAHPTWRGLGAEAAKHPPMRGWLAVPMVGREGRNLGLVQLSDKYEGEFTEDDESVLVQLARLASVAIENARLYEDLQEGHRHKDEFLATLAHELRNPLAPIRTGLEVLKLAPDDPALVDQIRATMEGQTQQLVRLVDDLLDVSRITSGRVTLRTESVELAWVVQSAVEATRSLVEDSGHQLSITLPDQPIYFEGDPTRLVQILTNLLTNAVRYTPRGGRIRLTVERQEQEATVMVDDTGIGIAADTLESIFEMFRQVDRSLEHSHGGLGIGLTLVKRLVEMHGGSIEAHSEGPGQGSRFIMRLPIADDPAEKPQSAEAPQAPPSGSLRVLIVDDNRDAATTLSMVVKLLGNHVRLAHDGLEAIDVAAQFRPDVVLMDIGMPRLNGYDAARGIREQDWGKDMTLVALTGWGQDDDRERTKEAGFDHHLVKPAEPEVLQKLLAELEPARPE